MDCTIITRTQLNGSFRYNDASMTAVFISLLLLQIQASKPDPVKTLVLEIAASGRVSVLAESASERVSPEREIAPGAPPLLIFRYLEGRDRHRFNQLGLVIDDAGH